MSEKYSDETIKAARDLYESGLTLPEAAKRLKISRESIYQWARKYQWGRVYAHENVLDLLTTRIAVLAAKDSKTRIELDEFDMVLKRLDSLAITMEKTARIKSGSLDNLIGMPPPEKKRGRKPGYKPSGVKNDVSGVQYQELEAIRKKLFYGYQQEWFKAKESLLTRRNRFILKSRQIGATYYFAWEALEDAILTGDNQIFLSASRDQAEVFKHYIVQFAKNELEIELTGNPIKLSNGAELRFLSTNSRTSQSYHGHLYLDEVFWIPQFSKLWRVSSGMAAHRKWRRTLFSTPSTLSHDAYEMWSGKKFNEGKTGDATVEFDVSHSTLKNGLLGEDKIWRHVVTVEDAERDGCNLFDIEELRKEYNTDDFANLFMCKFIDDAQSVFPLQLLLACGVDNDCNWTDYHINKARPFGNKPVAIGYDPSRTTDNASLVLMSVPIRPDDKWQLLHRISLHGKSFQHQADCIRDVVNRHNVVHVGIDVSGMGWGVYELVQGFYPSVQPITYSLQMKNQLIIKALDVIQPPSRLEFDAGDKEIVQSFLMIRRTMSETGHITYATTRTNTNGHADVAWACMHAMIYEPISRDIVGTRVSFSN
jgi:uncharacterized protein YjcR